MKFLIAGLGNIGAEYARTRHNIGFQILDYWAEQKDLVFTPDRYADYANFRFRGKQVHLIKPSTYMNLSGKAVKYWVNKLNIPVNNLLVVVDDLALPFGKLRLKGRGSDGGHNGLKDIQAELQTTNYNRLRFGIGNEFSKGYQANYVLSPWSVEESSDLPNKMKESVKIIESWMHSGLQRTMTSFN